VAGRIARGEVRLYQFAAPDKKRPVLVLTRNSAIAYLSTVTIAPVTSTIGIFLVDFAQHSSGYPFGPSCKVSLLRNRKLFTPCKHVPICEYALFS
jgi:hypothetical protein